MSIDIPSAEDFAELSKHRHAGSVSVYVASGHSGDGEGRQPIVHDTEAARLALRSAITDALAEMDGVTVGRADRDSISEAVLSLERDRNFWGTQARTVAVFTSPTLTKAFRLRNELPQHTAVGDRFDVGPLLRAATFGHSGYVLAITEGDVRLLLLTSDASHVAVDLPDLPADVADAFTTAEGGGRFDRRRADGTLGPKVEQRSYCSAVQGAVLKVIGNSGLPLVLSAASDLEPAYRDVNTYDGLVPQGIDANPTSLSPQDLAQRGRAVLQERFDEELAAWRENFGSLRANGRASSQMSDIARAAAAGLVDTLLFDLASTAEGSIDDAGALTFADEAGPGSYGLLDELAVRVLRTGGTVKAVRSEDLPDDSPVAATFRASA